jgi:hypothetical protein
MFQRAQKPGWEKTGFRPLEKNRVSAGLETRLAKNRVSTVGKKPGFSGARNPVGKKPGFFIDLFARQKPGFSKKPGFLSIYACKLVLIAGRFERAQKPGWQKTGFLHRFERAQKPGWEKTGFRPLAKNRVSGPHSLLKY